MDPFQEREISYSLLPNRQKVIVIEQHMHQVFAGALLRIARGGDMAGCSRRKLRQCFRVGKSCRLVCEKLVALGALGRTGRPAQDLLERNADEFVSRGGAWFGACFS